jgi:hypothetical protein
VIFSAMLYWLVRRTPEIKFLMIFAAVVVVAAVCTPLEEYIFAWLHFSSRVLHEVNVVTGPRLALWIQFNFQNSADNIHIHPTHLPIYPAHLRLTKNR